jgi:hypothetical protein
MATTEGGRTTASYEAQMQAALQAATKIMSQIDFSALSLRLPAEGEISPETFNCAGTAGTFGTFCGCGGTAGTFGCAACIKQN